MADYDQCRCPGWYTEIRSMPSKAFFNQEQE